MDITRLALTCMLLLTVSSALQNSAAGADQDPIVEFNPSVVADEYADSMYPASEYGSRLVLYVGNSYDRVQNRSGPARIYIQFDLSEIARRAHIVSAEMGLYQMYAPASSVIYEVHMVESTWNEPTMEWNTQPTSNPSVVSTVRVPTEKNVWVSWNVTSALQAWVNGESPNYGFMIQIQDERTGVANEASGFYSREYPKEDLQPRLRVLCQSQPPFTFLISTRASGLPAELSTRVTSDVNQTVTVHGGEVGYLLFESGKTYTISADEYVNAGTSIRYRAKVNSFVANTDEEFTVTYEPQFLVTVKSEPPGLIEREWSEWCDLGARIETPSAREVAEETTDMRLVLDGWYINDARQLGNPIAFIVNGPATVTAKYTTLYNVTVSSPFGTTSGTGWHAAGSTVEILVTPTYVPLDGVLGYLGLGMAFDHWSGSFENTSPTTTITVNGPIQANAVWREDRSRLVLGIAVAIAIAIVVLVILRRGAKDSRSRKPSGR